MFTFYFKIAVSEAHFHIINHLCSCLEIVLFVPVQFWRQREQDYISKDKKCMEIKKIRTFKELECTRYTRHIMSLVYVTENYYFDKK